MASANHLFKRAVGTRPFQISCCRITAGMSLSTPFPVLADIVITGTPRKRGKANSSLSRIISRISFLSSLRSHLLMAMTMARPSRSTRSASCTSCLSNGVSASISKTTISANLTALSASATESFSSFSDTRDFLRIPAVSHNFIGLFCSPSCHCQSIPIASRVIPASGPVNILSSPSI